MSVCLGDFLQTGLRRICRVLAYQPTAKAERLYQKGVGFKNGDGEEKNLRESFRLFKEASESGHTEAIKELAECYLHGRGCERDLIKQQSLAIPN